MVFTTLSSTGRRIFARLPAPFETVLVDEAAQASEIAALQALAFGCRRRGLPGRGARGVSLQPVSAHRQGRVCKIAVLQAHGQLLCPRMTCIRGPHGEGLGLSRLADGGAAGGGAGSQ